MEEAGLLLSRLKFPIVFEGYSYRLSNKHLQPLGPCGHKTNLQLQATLLTGG